MNFTVHQRIYENDFKNVNVNSDSALSFVIDKVNRVKVMLELRKNELIGKIMDEMNNFLFKNRIYIDRQKPEYITLISDLKYIMLNLDDFCYVKLLINLSSNKDCVKYIFNDKELMDMIFQKVYDHQKFDFITILNNIMISIENSSENIIKDFIDIDKFIQMVDYEKTNRYENVIIFFALVSSIYREYTSKNISRIFHLISLIFGKYGVSRVYFKPTLNMILNLLNYSEFSIETFIELGLDKFITVVLTEGSIQHLSQCYGVINILINKHDFSNFEIDPAIVETHALSYIPNSVQTLCYLMENDVNVFERIFERLHTFLYNFNNCAFNTKLGIISIINTILLNVDDNCVANLLERFGTLIDILIYGVNIGEVGSYKILNRVSSLCISGENDYIKGILDGNHASVMDDII